MNSTAKTKIVFFDIDGTLIDMTTKKITDKTLQMLCDLQKRGIRICIATGRSPIAIPVFPGITFDAYLAFNGAYCYAGDADIYSSPIPHADVIRIVKNAALLRRPVCAATKDCIRANGSDKDLADYFAISKQKLHIEAAFDVFIRQDIYQIMMGCRKKDYPAILEGTDGAKIAAWWDRAADIIPKAAGKGVGVRKILDYFHLDRSEAMAFGDGSNDIEMIEAAGCGVAMANGSDDLKAAADDMCGACIDDGIYYYLKEKGII